MVMSAARASRTDCRRRPAPRGPIPRRRPRRAAPSSRQLHQPDQLVPVHGRLQQPRSPGQLGRPVADDMRLDVVRMAVVPVPVVRRQDVGPLLPEHFGQAARGFVHIGLQERRRGARSGPTRSSRSRSSRARPPGRCRAPQPTVPSRPAAVRPASRRGPGPRALLRARRWWLPPAPRGDPRRRRGPSCRRWSGTRRRDGRESRPGCPRRYLAAPEASSASTSSRANPQSSSTSCVCCPGWAGGRSTAPGVRLRRGAGAGWSAPATSMKVPLRHVVGMLSRLAHGQHGCEAHVACPP